MYWNQNKNVCAHSKFNKAMGFKQFLFMCDHGQCWIPDLYHAYVIAVSPVASLTFLVMLKFYVNNKIVSYKQ